MEFEVNVPYVQKVYEYLKNAIITDELMQGQVLNERELSEQMNISRTPLRDGLALLEKEGWVMKNGKYRVVSRLSWRDIQEIYDLRMLIEGYTVRQAALNRTEEDLRWLQELLEKMERCFRRDPDLGRLEFLQTDLLWHLSVDKICGNERLTQILDNLYDQFVRISYITTKRGHLRMKESVEEHRSIFLAILEQDTDKAERALKEHVSAWYQSLNENWEGEK